MWGVAGLVAVVAVLVSVPVLGWWSLLLGVVLLALLGLFALLLHMSRSQPPLPPPVEDPRPREPVTPVDDSSPPQRKHLSQLPLPSAHQDYDFLFSAVVYWRAHAPLDAGTQGTATSLVLDRARALTKREPPEEYGVVRHRVSAELGQVTTLEQGMLDVWADDIRVELREEDARRLDRIRDLRKDEALREQEREVERSQRRYLGNDVLANPGQAVAWWLSRDSQQIEETVGQIGTLSRLSAAASGNDIPRLYRELMAELAGTTVFRNGPGNAGAGWDNGFVNGAGAFSTNSHGVASDGDDGGGSTSGEEGDQLNLLHRMVATMTSNGDEYEREQVIDRIAGLLEDQELAELARQFRESYAVPNVWAEEEAPPSDGFDAPSPTDPTTESQEDAEAGTHGGGDDTNHDAAPEAPAEEDLLAGSEHRSTLS